MKIIKFAIALIIGIIVVFICYSYCSKSILQKNFRNFSTNRYFVYTDIEYENTRFKIVIDNYSLYSLMNKQNHLSKLGYVLKMNYNTCFKKTLKVNNKYYKELNQYIINDKDLSIFDSLKSIDNFINNQYLNPQLDSNKKDIFFKAKNKFDHRRDTVCPHYPLKVETP